MHIHLLASRVAFRRCCPLHGHSLDRKSGRPQKALESLEAGRPALALAEPPSPGESTGQPLAQAISPVYYRTKATYVFWMLRDLVGDPALSAALRDYSPAQDAAHALGPAASPDDFEKLLEKPASVAISPGSSPIGSTPTRACPTSPSTASFLRTLRATTGLSPSTSPTPATPPPKSPSPSAIPTPPSPSASSFPRAAKPLFASSSRAGLRRSRPTTAPFPKPRPASTSAPSPEPIPSPPSPPASSNKQARNSDSPKAKRPEHPRSSHHRLLVPSFLVAPIPIPYSLFPFFLVPCLSFTLNQIGVPLNPNASRIWFSRNRSNAKCSLMFAIRKQHERRRRHRRLRHIKDPNPLRHRHRRALKVDPLQEPIHLPRRHALAPLLRHRHHLAQHRVHPLPFPPVPSSADRKITGA